MLPAGGYVVREFTQADIRDAIELRGVLEGTAARFAAERGSQPPRPPRAARDQRARSSRSSTAPTTSRSSATSHLNEQFHARLLKMARSPLLERTLDGDRVAAVRDARARSCSQQAQLPESREILIVAHRHHLWLVEAIERARARAPTASPASTRGCR